MRQVEVSGTMVFDAPHRARSFFEALIAATRTWAARRTWRSSSAGGCAATPPAPSCTAIDRPGPSRPSQPAFQNRR